LRLVKPSARNITDEGPTWLRRAAWALLAAYVALSIYVLWRSAVLSVFSDEFDWAGSVYQLQADHRWAAYLLAPHNLNRLAWTRLLVVFDMEALGGTNAPLIISGALALGATAAMLSWQAARAAPAPLKAPAAALAAMLTLTAGNVLDASTPIYATYTHAAAFAVLALALSEGGAASPFGWRGVLAVLSAMASAFGSGAGLALWPVMAWGALRRGDWRWLALVVVAGSAFVAAYLAGQPHGAGAGALSALRDPNRAAVLALSYLTLPWTRLALDFAWTFGALIGAGALALALLNGGKQAAPARRIASGFILFTLTTAAMTALGRSGDYDPANPPLRYGLLVAPLQVGLLMLAAPWAERLWRRRRRVAEAACVAVLAAMLAHDLVFSMKVIEASDIVREAIVDFHAGVRTPRMLSLIYPDLGYAQAMSARLERDGLFRRELHLKPQSDHEPGRV
jgi:hypothetical protein